MGNRRPGGTEDADSKPIRTTPSICQDREAGLAGSSSIWYQANVGARTQRRRIEPGAVSIRQGDGHHSSRVEEYRSDASIGAHRRRACESSAR